MFSILAKRFRATWLRPCLIVAAVLLTAALPAAQKSVVIPLLPAPAWRLESTSTLSLQSLTVFGDQIPVDKELGVTSGSKRIYRMRDFQPIVIFEQATDPSSAYALYTLYQSTDMRPVEGIDLAVANSKFALMTRGRYFIRVLHPADPALPNQALKTLLAAIGGARLSVENAESLPTGLPTRGLEPRTEKYILGPEAAKFAFPSFPARLIGFADGVEAKAGTYRSGRSGPEGKDRMVLLEISYPTPQLAQARFQQMVAALHMNQDAGPGSIYGRQDGSFALLVLNAQSQSAATRFLDRFRITQTVSAVPKYPRKENIVLEVVQLFVANGELIGIVLVLAILGGIFIYLTKRLIMKVFPKSNWIRADDDILIRLKLS
ncbi:MAG: DUF6599 family protein [Terriglobia bacterium]